MFTAFYVGFFTSLSLILAIGAQNALILRQGLAKSHIFWPCLFCATADTLLIFIGVFGLATISNLWPIIPEIMKWGGIVFLVSYGLIRLWAAYKGEYNAELSGKAKPLKQVLGILVLITFLNPHVYLDTIGLVGAVSLQFDNKIAFAIGAALASAVFFFSLGYGARMFAPYFKSAKTWRVLDVIIALVMFAIAFGLLKLH